jgi:Heme exporter protein D (CcmD).
MFTSHTVYVFLAYFFAFLAIIILFFSSTLLSQKYSKLIEKIKEKND